MARSVVVIDSVRPRSGAVDLDKLAEHFGARCRAVCRIPFDPHLEDGAKIELDRSPPMAGSYPHLVVQSQPNDPVVIEPVVNREKLRELLGLGAEYATLDFKATQDLGRKKDQVELAKDIGAMSVRGGFLIIGVDGHGGPTGELTPEQVALFDEARLRPKLLKWLPDTLEIYSQAHEVGGHQVMLVHVAPNPAGCAFFQADGQYDQAGKGSKVVFREGDVFHRDGTQSVLLNHRGLELVIQRRVERARLQWEADRAEAYQRLAEELRAGAAGQHVARGPAVEFNLALEPDVLVEAAVELLRAGDDIPLRRMLSRAVPELRALFRSADEGGVATLLDRLTCLAATFLELDRVEWFTRSLDTMMTMYGIGFESLAPILNTPPIRSAELWLTIIEHVIALGALAVRLENWLAVQSIVDRRHPDMHKIYTTWIRHAMTMASRAQLLTTRNGTSEFLDSLLSRARNIIRRLEPLRPELDATDGTILTNLTQFDFLADLVTLGNSDNREGIFPNFARFSGARTQPAAQRLLGDPATRQIIYPGPDRQLAEALIRIDEEARRAGFHYDGWGGYTPDVYTFIENQGVRTTRG